MIGNGGLDKGDSRAIDRKKALYSFITYQEANKQNLAINRKNFKRK